MLGDSATGEIGTKSSIGWKPIFVNSAGLAALVVLVASSSV